MLGKETFQKDGHTCTITSLSAGGLLLGVENYRGGPQSLRLLGSPQGKEEDGGHYFSCLVPLSLNQSWIGVPLGRASVFPQKTYSEAGQPEWT